MNDNRSVVNASIRVVSDSKPQLRPKCPKCGGNGVALGSVRYEEVVCIECNNVFEWVKPTEATKVSDASDREA